MWLDGLYMGAPFLTEYALTFEKEEALEDVIKQFTLCFTHTLDPKTGLLYHAWDEQKSSRGQILRPVVQKISGDDQWDGS